MVSNAVYFAIYESTKQLAIKYQGADQPVTLLASTIGGGACGTISMTITYPFDSIKSAYQRSILENGEVPKLVDMFKERLKTGDTFKGWRVAAIRAGVGSGILFPIFEKIKHLINEMEMKKDG